MFILHQQSEGNKKTDHQQGGRFRYCSPETTPALQADFATRFRLRVHASQRSTEFWASRVFWIGSRRS